MPPSSSKTVCFVAGESGGHIIPALTLAQHLKAANPHYRILLITTDGTFDQQLAQQAHQTIDAHLSLNLGPRSRRRLGYTVSLGWRMIKATLATLRFLRAHAPQVVTGMGGLVCLPVCLAATMLRIPIDLYELNAVPGKAVKMLARLARTIWIVHEGSKKQLPAKKCLLTSYPVRYEPEDRKISPADARAHLDLDQNRPTLLVLGGSQGSVSLNQFVGRLFKQDRTLKDKLQIIHQTGDHDQTDWPAFYQQHNVHAHVFSFADNLRSSYAAANLVLTRAGAGTLAEITFFEKPCIIVPLVTPHNDHQRHNAQAYATACPAQCHVLTHTQLAQSPELLHAYICRRLNLPLR